jgi:aminoglycoside N3'-acetyltransferase
MAIIITSKPLTRSDIEDGLYQLGLRPGQIVEVHSSLGSLGHVEGGAGTVIEALMNVIGSEGAIVMSAYPVSKLLPLTEEEKSWGILGKVRVYDDDYRAPTGMGVIADEFCLRPDTVLGPSPHRVCAWGRNAEQLSLGYQVLLEMDGDVLLLGVDIERCSCMHQAEKNPLPPEIAGLFELPEEIAARYSDDYYIAYGQSPVNAWLKIQSQAEKEGIIKIGTIGQATCRFFKARPVVEAYAEALRTDPWALFGVKNPNN